MAHGCLHWLSSIRDVEVALPGRSGPTHSVATGVAMYFPSLHMLHMPVLQGKFSQHFHLERATSFAYECGFPPQAVNLGGFDSPRHDVRFNFDDRAGRPTDQATSQGAAKCNQNARASMSSRDHPDLLQAAPSGGSRITASGPLFFR